MNSSGSSSGAFSFDTPQALMHVLASVRKSDISPADKNSLRDLILSYTNGGKDPSLKIQIEQKLASLAVQPLPPPAPPVPPPVFGSSRSVPTTFTASVKTNPETKKTQQPAPAVSTTTTPVMPASQPVAPQVSSAPATPLAREDTQPVAASSMPVQPSLVQETPQKTQPAQPSVQNTPVVPPAQQTPAVALDNSAALARVREIKAIVNEKIGNPVNLVDIDNKVGREYMSALLEAMKKLSSGANSASAMQRLEAAFVEVKRVLEQAQSDTTPVTATSPAPASSVSVSDSTTVQSPVSTPAPTSVVPPTDSRDIPAGGASQSVTPPIAPMSKVPPIPTPSTSIPTRKPTPSQEPVEKHTVTTPAPNTTAQQQQPPSLNDSRWSSSQTVTPSTAPASTTSTPVTASPTPFKPLSESAEPLKSITDVPTQDSITNKNADPLQTQEVTEGLNQLLSDWILFKKSGLFGTGPKGIDHPLYQKIKDLQIPMLLAGRFDGATQEIKQSITDYMNGWRYEQGIIYEQGETFDHYLRRVIRHILDLQK
jgi:hypothetical protein